MLKIPKYDVTYAKPEAFPISYSIFCIFLTSWLVNKFIQYVKVKYPANLTNKISKEACLTWLIRVQLEPVQQVAHRREAHRQHEQVPLRVLEDARRVADKNGIRILETPAVHAEGTRGQRVQTAH